MQILVKENEELVRLYHDYTKDADDKAAGRLRPSHFLVTEPFEGDV